MITSFVASCVFTLVLAVSCVSSVETLHEAGIESAEHKTEHHALKRMAVNNDEGTILVGEDALDDLPVEDNYLDKRGSLFRFGKRGSLLRFGKRQGGTLFRFGKRGGALFRFGRSWPADNYFDNAQQADVDVLRNVLSQHDNSPLNQDGAAGKRGIDSFHWGSDSEN